MLLHRPRLDMTMARQAERHRAIDNQRRARARSAEALNRAGRVPTRYGPHLWLREA